jgi:hypothetical protein
MTGNTQHPASAYTAAFTEGRTKAEPRPVRNSAFYQVPFPCSRYYFRRMVKSAIGPSQLRRLAITSRQLTAPKPSTCYYQVINLLLSSRQLTIIKSSTCYYQVINLLLSSRQLANSKSATYISQTACPGIAFSPLNLLNPNH